MSLRLGVLVFARYDSTRLPGKALRLVGGMPLLARVIRRAQAGQRLPVFLATTDRASDDPLVALSDSLGVDSFRGSSERVLERAVLAAEAFGLDAFVRLCGDRPLFPVEDMLRATAVMRDAPDGEAPDLVTTYREGVTTRGLVTEVVRTATLRRLLDCGPAPGEQEHVTPYFYAHPDEFRIVRPCPAPTGYACPGFAVDTDADLANVDGIFAVSDAVDLTPAEADRIYRRRGAGEANR